MNTWKWDACIIGLGRVGLPLALSLRDVGHRVTGVDVSDETLAALARGELPFREPGFEHLLAEAPFDARATPEAVAESRVIIVAVATPLRDHLEPDLRRLERAVDDLAPHLRAGQLVCLRSTVPPRTSWSVRQRIERNTGLKFGHDLWFAYCPERVAQGHVYRELREFPQVVGADDPHSAEMATSVFAPLVSEVLHTSTTNAELVKLFINAQRYVDFAVANQFAVFADRFGGDVHEIIELANHRYGRTRIARPGFTGGTCLRKDFGMLVEPAVELGILDAAWKTNEAMPALVVRGLADRIDLQGLRVALLGFSFKANSDDLRDSLSHRLRRYIARQGVAEVRVTDTNLPNPIPDTGDGPIVNHDLDDCLRDIDCVVVAVNHAEYPAALARLGELAPDAWVADLWNCGGTGRVFYRASEVRVPR